MALNSLSALQTLVSTWVDDVSNGYFTLPQITTFINNAQREVQKQLLQAGELWYATPVQSTTVLGQNTYTLPSDFLKLHRLEVIISGTPPNESSSTIEPLTLNEQDLEPPGIGTPAGHVILQNVLYLYPAPDTAALPLRLWYSPLVADMVNTTDVPNVPTQYQEYIAILATIDCFLKDQRDPGPWMEKKTYYLELMKADAQARTQDASRHVVITQGDGFENLF
jgi:hypothetical protein